ncbi:MAG: hypothetical protein ACOYMA_20920 [Bacteroidia bacterium]
MKATIIELAIFQIIVAFISDFIRIISGESTFMGLLIISWAKA